ncbi:TM2 domain-containing protein [Paludifilum halophilum]|uniref:TM2 domain-containing protein n=1 Tax=Paludifilum halophilum TaxID=1642702 RepID=A0A235B5R3_9BACL|nr:TM2 domain-containing protein [Paludifilum halophilum]OYD06935.1 hypothetical protein CHM34_13425 [Paludifilum halophilum]
MDHSKPPADGRSPATAERGDKEKIWTAYGLWLFLGSFGAHRFYFGKWVTGFLMAFAGAATWTLAIIFAVIPGSVWVVAAPFLLWWGIDAFLIPRWVRLTSASGDEGDS